VLVAAYLYTCGCGFDQSLEVIRHLRPQVSPTFPILTSMRRIFGLPDAFQTGVA
jgi:hypothetical protein